MTRKRKRATQPTDLVEPDGTIDMETKPHGRPNARVPLDVEANSDANVRRAIHRGTARERDMAFAEHGFLFDISLRDRRGRNLLAAYALYTEYLGGEENLTFGQLELVRRAAGFAVEAADIEERLADGPLSKDDFDRYTQLTKVVLSLTKQLGMERPLKVINEGPATLEEAGYVMDEA